MKMAKFLTRNYSCLGVSLMMAAWLDRGRGSELTGVADGVRDVEYARTVWWLDNDWIEALSNVCLTEEPAFFRTFLSRGVEAGNRLSLTSLDLYGFSRNHHLSLSAENLRDFLTWQDCFRTNAAYILVTHPLAKPVELRLLKILEKYGEPESGLDQTLLSMNW